MGSPRITELFRSIRAAVAVAGLMVVACGDGRSAMAETSLHGAGATFPAPLYKRWIEVYQKDHPHVALSYDAVGSGEGFGRFVAGSVDFAGTDAILRDDEVATVTKGVVIVPATAGMVVLAYNLPGVPAGLKLPREVYTDIFAGKQALSWDDPRLVAANPGVPLPHRTIAVVARLDGSGTTFAFSRHLDEVGGSWREMKLSYGTTVAWPAGAMLARGNEGVAARINISKGAIGYVEYGFAKRLGLTVAALQNKSGAFVLPTEQSGQVALGEATAPTADDLRLSAIDPALSDAYPIVTYSWLLLHAAYADANKAAAMKEFVDWGLDAGQGFAGEFGYIPIPPAIAQRGAAAVRNIP